MTQASIIQKKKILIVLFASAFFYFYQFFFRNSPSVFGNYISQEFNTTATMFGLFSSMYYIPYVILQVPLGILFDTIGPKSVILFGSLACILGSFLLYLSGSFNMILFSRLIIGMGASTAFTGAIKINSSWVPSKNLAFALGFLSSFGKLGGAVSGILLPFLILYIGSWRDVFLILAIAGLPISFLIYQYVKDSPEQSSINNKIDNTNKKKIDFSKVLKNLISVSKSKTVWMIGIYSYCMHLPFSVFSDTWASAFFMSNYGISLQKASSMKSFMLIGSCIGAPLFSYFSDTIQKRLLPIRIASLLCLVSMVWTILFPPSSLLLCSLLLFTLGISASGQIIAYAISNESAPVGFSGSSNSIVSMLTMSGGMLHSPLIGLLIDCNANGIKPSINNYKFAMCSIIIALVISFILSFCIPETFIKNRK